MNLLENMVMRSDHIMEDVLAGDVGVAERCVVHLYQQPRLDIHSHCALECCSQTLPEPILFLKVIKEPGKGCVVVTKAAL